MDIRHAESIGIYWGQPLFNLLFLWPASLLPLQPALKPLFQFLYKARFPDRPAHHTFFSYHPDKRFFFRLPQILLPVPDHLPQHFVSANQFILLCYAGMQSRT
jgi:hypothetical protein